MVKPDLKARIFRAAAILHKHKISQAELADIVGASQPQVSRILNAKGLRATKLPVAVLNPLCRAPEWSPLKAATHNFVSTAKVNLVAGSSHRLPSESP